MATYLILNLAFITAITLGLRIRRRPGKAWWAALIVLLVLTAVFDNVIIGLGVVTYDHAKNLGILLGHAPVEDFFYTLMAMILVPVLWRAGGSRG